MTNIIEITEKNNRLDFTNTYSPIVCGNSNYYLKFNFSEVWQNCEKKAAMFVVDGKKQTVDFDGDSCKVPILPNSSFVFVSLFSSEGEEQMVTTPIRIRLEPSAGGENLSEFNQMASYLTKVLGAINKIANGELSVNTASFAENVSNPNLLINGDFKVNQRGESTYSTTNKYTVDRWKLVSGSVIVETNGITLNGTIIQKLEHSPTGDVVCSVDATGGSPSISYSNGAVTITTTTATLIKWAKLEVGTTATTFSPRTYAEELALCQRYGFMMEFVQRERSVIYTSTLFDFNVQLLQKLRTKPTIDFSRFEVKTILNTPVPNITWNWSIVNMFSNTMRLRAQTTGNVNHNLTDAIFNVKEAVFVDAEIY